MDFINSSQQVGSIRTWALPSKSFPIHHSFCILPSILCGLCYSIKCKLIWEIFATWWLTHATSYHMVFGH